MKAIVRNGMEMEFVGRQGDVILFRIVKNVPEVEMNKGKVVLAYGEAHGHTHAPVVEVKHAMLDEAQYGIEGMMEVEEATYLRHGTTTKEKHGRINLDPGVYGWIIQREWTEEEERKVRD